ncbi:S8 family serine peptidase [Massilia pseudoviolaceinigra]|uniref:S8 family serine peptidase n=1 Tax=Massilia pseudoviolaceinigra TaxID=3057165 RepID=UPI0027965D41|nr:S8 family serine peptidase [Massilia sp. CCM 9206]MDQ1919262.1 S8 family serine peptidase [Massilia sp. CCM 9206]
MDGVSRSFILRQAGIAVSPGHFRGSAASARIALLDGAADLAHPALGGERIVTSAAPASSSAGAHATFCVSLLVGNDDDARQGRVLALCAGATVFNFPVIDDAMLQGRASIAATADALARALRQAVDAGCRTIVFSTELLQADSPHWRCLRDAVQWARAQGAIVVVPAGNHGAGWGQVPCPWPGILVVGSIGASGNISEFSAHARRLPNVVYAPGEQVPGAGAGHGYELRSGTSFAAVLAAGALELLRVRRLSDAWPDLVATLFRPPWRFLDASVLSQPNCLAQEIPI